jgi:hypothetical protein
MRHSRKRMGATEDAADEARPCASCRTYHIREIRRPPSSARNDNYSRPTCCLIIQGYRA